MLGNFSSFCRLLIFFSKFAFSKHFSRNTIRVSNILDPDQGRHSVGPDLGANCLQRLSADVLMTKIDSSKERVKKMYSG